MSGEINVTYGVKELLALQNDKLDRIEVKVDQGNLETIKALTTLDHRVTVLEQRPDPEPRIRALEEESAGTKGEREFKRWMLPVAAAAAGVVAYWVPLLFHMHP